MSNTKPEGSNGKSGANGRRRVAKPPRRAPARGKRIRVEPTRRERVDPQMIALCYWLLAQRIVQEADEAAATKHQDAAEPDDDQLAGPDSGAGS